MNFPFPKVVLSGVSLYHSILKWLVYALAALSAVSIMVMMVITCTDVVLRLFNRPIKGAYDIVLIAIVVTITGALPYTTAVKGHVAIEVFYHKLSRIGRIIMDTGIRILSMVLFGVLAYQSYLYGDQLRNTNQVTLTLQIPLFWVPYLIALSSIVVVFVIFDNLLHPGKEMIKP
jgi:TRAP-type C4-dicarboxylate transport system permease small subunit